MAPPRARNEGREKTAEEHICRWEGRKCVRVHGSESERARNPHVNASISACRCVDVCAQAEARAPPGTCDHTQRSNIWQRTAELQHNKWFSQRRQSSSKPAEREIIILDVGLKPSLRFFLCSLADSFTCAALDS